MSLQSPADAEREHRLIEQLELRIASANTDAKFESVVQKFLAALILKVGSENARNRNLAIKICQHINQRLKLDSSISLPVQSLLKTLRESQNAFVSRFALIFVEQGLGRLPPDQRSAILPEVLSGSIPEQETYEAVQGKIWSVAFGFLLDVLKTWRIPEHATKEEAELQTIFKLSSEQSSLLSDMLSNFITYDSKTQSSLKPLPADFKSVFEKYSTSRSQVIVPIAKFLFTSVFSDSERFAPAVLLSVDGNDSASGIADVMFKQCNFDLESDQSIDLLLEIFDLDRPKMQIKVLSLLSRSQKSTNRASRILEIVEKQLFKSTSGLEATKLRSAVFQYLTWAVRVSNDLFVVRDKLQAVLREYIELQGWPLMQQPSTADIDLRAKAYESIGLLAALKSLQASTMPVISLDMITWLFTSLRCDTTGDVRASIDEALSRILNVFTLTSEDDKHRFKDLLLWNVKAQEGDQDPVYFFRTVNSTRYLAVRFANKVLAFHDIDARYINVLALGYNDRREVAEEGLRGLDPYWHITSAKLSSGPVDASELSFPLFDKFVLRSLGSSDTRHKTDLPLPSIAAAVAFGRSLLVHESLTGSELQIEPQSDWERRQNALIKNDPFARAILHRYTRQINLQSMVSLIENSILGMSQGSLTCAEVAFDLVSLSSNQILQHLNADVLLACKKASLNNTVQAQAARVFGIISSLAPQANEMVSQALSECTDWSTSVGQAAISVRASLLCAGLTMSRMALRGFDLDSNLTDDLYALASTIIFKSSDKSLKNAAYYIIGQLCMCMPPITKWFSKISELADDLMADAKKEEEVAVTTLGRLVGSLNTNQTEESEKLLQRVYGLHEVRKAELHFALGEALATAALGFRSQSTLSEFDIDGPKPDWGFHPLLFTRVLEESINDSKQTKPSLKKASAIWLLSLIQYCDDASLLKPHLRECQAAFARLLNDRDEIVQETGSRGLSLVYEKGDKSLRDDLVRDLVQSFTGGNAKLSGTVSEDTQLFEAGTLPTEGGQSVQTYKDIVSLATEMGDPSLVYRFMNLASNNAIWTTRAAFGRFGLSGVLADSTYLTENKKFYPKLFRYRFDPNPNVQRSMDEIWKALVKDPNKVIEENFDLIMTDLLKSIISGKEWRAREASCGAISDLVQGREVEKFERYLDEIWNVAFKVLDDVKETVRVAAMKLCRTLTGMLIRNLEVGGGTTRRATTMMQHAVPFLLQQMEGGSAQEVQQYTVITLLEITRKSPPKSLRPFAPQILERLVLSLSSLEHESINYLHLNADKYGLTTEKLDKMRVSSINTSPVSEAIERCLESLFLSGYPERKSDQHMDGGDETANDPAGTGDPTTLDAMHRLEGTFKTAIGLPSKVGLSRVMITLVVRHHAAFRPYADRFLQLTRKHILDRNATISISFSMALGYLVRLASPKEVNETSGYAQRLYFESQELAHRAVAGEMVQAISKASNDVFMNFAGIFLPFAFVGRNDLDSEVRNRFDPPWKDNVGGSRALNLYLTEIVDLVSKHITSSLWPIRQACCLAVAELVSSMEGTEQYSEAQARLLWKVVEESLNGKTWDGKEKVILAYPTFVKRSRSIWDTKGHEMKKIALREAKRSNAAYRPHALTALGEVASARPDLELDQEVLTVLTNVVTQLEEHEDAMEVDGGEEQAAASARYVLAHIGTGARLLIRSNGRHADETVTAAVTCVFQILKQSSQRPVLDRGLQLIERAHGKMSSAIDMEIYAGARRYITQATTVAAAEGLSRSSSDQGGGSSQGRVVPPASSASGGDRQTQDQAAKARENSAAFLHGLVLALYGSTVEHSRYSSEHETLRKSRVALAKALTESGLLNQPARGLLIPTLTSWMQGERSRPLKTDLEKTLRLLER